MFRIAAGAIEPEMLALLGKKYAKVPLDVVVAVCAAAGDTSVKERLLKGMPVGGKTF